MLATSAEDRNHDIAGPMFQETVAVQEKPSKDEEQSTKARNSIEQNSQERIGDWIRCEKGWLPLCIGRASWGTFA